MRNVKVLAGILVIITGMFDVVTASAQDYPTKAIRLIVPSSPGVSSDIAARILAPTLAKLVGQPIVVENKTGAGMILGLEYVARQMPADGYTVLVASSTNLATLPLTSKDLRFDPLKDLPPVIVFVDTRLLLGSPSTVPWKSYAEMVSHAKANPGKLNYGASSPNIRMMTEMIIRTAGLDIVHIPYSGGGAYIQAFAGGSAIQLGFLNEGTASGLGEKFRVLATTGDRRMPKLPDVPTLAEIGYPKVPGNPYSLNVRFGTPASIVQKLYFAASQSLQQPELKALLEKSNFIVTNENAQTAAKTLAEQAALFAEVAKQVGIQPQ